ncbi:DsbA family oxidoreductase [Streptococcus sp. H31]|uniref:DsbA family oxidoreductase n=1 Tax=Streptococcus huangxiaojuni TaxID=3237239 RepID=UPI0034A16433
MKITYWSDYACPYCYIGETRLKKAINKLGLENIVSFEMKAFQLDPYAPVQSVGPTQKRFAQKYGISYEQAGQRIEQISALGRQEGLSFNYLSTLFTNTMDAHRLTKLVQETGSKEQVEELKSALFQAYFADNKELADYEVLLAAAVQAGLDQETVETFLEGERFKQQVLADQEEARQLGISGVPYFVIDDRYAVAGAQSQQGFETALRQAYLEELSESESDDNLSCGPEGCRI